MSNSIRQEVDIKASPKRIYDTLLDAKRFSEFTGAPAEIDPKSGGTFSCFGGVITGRNIELLPGQRIVQAWRVSVWPDGFYSIVKFELQPQGSQTRLVLDHVGFPEGDARASQWRGSRGGMAQAVLGAAEEISSVARATMG